MLSRRSNLAVAIAFTASLATGAASAGAAPKDKEALKLAGQAIMVEYLGTQFEQAQETLNKAMALCAESNGNCSPKVEAQLHRDMGVVLITGLGLTG